MENTSPTSAQKHMVTEVEARPLVVTVASYCTQILKEELPSDMKYHNFKHTQNVIKGVKKIGLHAGLSADELEILIIAAWFHDVGFRETYVGHEDASKEIAKKFLEEQGVDEKKTTSILACIDTTKRTSEPQNLIEEVIRDADLIHLSKGSYFKKLSALRSEWEVYFNRVYTDMEWNEDSIAFLRGHSYFTTYGQEILEVNKQKNLQKLQSMLKGLSREQDNKLMSNMHINEKKLKELKKKLEKVEGKPERGIETMFRLTSKNHISLSAIADQKASMMIQVNSIIITILLGALVPKLDSNPHLLIPTFFLLIINLGSIIFSALATRPN